MTLASVMWQVKLVCMTVWEQGIVMRGTQHKSWTFDRIASNSGDIKSGLNGAQGQSIRIWKTYFYMLFRYSLWKKCIHVQICEKYQSNTHNH